MILRNNAARGCYFALVFSVCPGLVIEILPPYAHINLQLSNNAGMFVISSLPPGAQGATVTGMHGIGVRTPIAAAVADATVGFAIERHIPKGIMFIIGTKSMMVALGLFCIIGRMGTVTISMEGVMPKLHFNMAPIQTYFAIVV